jgi:hypothetical protein
MKTFHILNGDHLAEQLKATKINQDFIICRECLIDGNISADNLSEFWELRAKFISETFGADDYCQNVVQELDKIENLPEDSDVCLWFENDLFCQVNMWFVLSLLSHQPHLKLYRVFPVVDNAADIWKGFGISTNKTLEKAYNSKVTFQTKDIELGNNLWAAYQSHNFVKLKELSKQNSACFRYLEEVCDAHIDRFPKNNSMNRPEKIIKEIIKSGSNDFQKIFAEFSAREGIYGFGDLQLKEIFKRLI